MPDIALILIVVVLFFATALKILREWERGVILRLGKFQAVRGPGITFVIPLLERMYRINTRVVTADVPPQDVITKDNVTLNVNAVVFFRVLNPKEAVVNVEDFYAATYQKVQTVLRNVLGQPELDELLAARDEIHTKLQSILDMAQRGKTCYADDNYVQDGTTWLSPLRPSPTTGSPTEIALPTITPCLLLLYG